MASHVIGDAVRSLTTLPYAGVAEPDAALWGMSARPKSRSVWSARSLLPLSDVAATSIAGASSAHSKRFARFRDLALCSATAIHAASTAAGSGAHTGVVECV